MQIIIVGLSHKTAPVEYREQLSFSEALCAEALQELSKCKDITESVILSTCNRTEIYAVTENVKEGQNSIIHFLSSYRNLDENELVKHLYFYDSVNAVNHLFRVVSSLDSMVIGEAQILGQAKEAYEIAFNTGTTGAILNRFFRHAFSVGKKVRTDTEIGESAVSISYAAVELAKKVFGSLENRTVMVVGAGEMSELTAKHLISNGIKTVLVANRTYERAVEFAERFNGKAVRFDDLFNQMVHTDIIISSTGSPSYIIKKSDVLKVMQARRNRSIFFIDIAVPRDIDPKVNNIYNVFLYDIDDLQSVVDANMADRSKEAKKAEVIIGQEIEDFVSWLSSLEVVPTISALKKQAERIRQMELEKALIKLNGLSEREKEIIEVLTNGIINKLFHKPIVYVKECANKKDGYLYIEALRSLFDLDEKDS
ncbi:MAG: glutamyl-tRNA reductase [Actinobacteria bacterium]|nr:glutamyl-tRNA reductase [Actinomycetota bacterium]